MRLLSKPERSILGRVAAEDNDTVTLIAGLSRSTLVTLAGAAADLADLAGEEIGRRDDADEDQAAKPITPAAGHGTCPGGC